MHERKKKHSNKYTSTCADYPIVQMKVSEKELTVVLRGAQTDQDDKQKTAIFEYLYIKQ